MALWPAAGIVIGLFQALVFCLADGIFPLQIAAVLALMAELWMTRGFHLDGLCDTADAVFSSRSRERMLEIMKDSHIGTFGVVAAVMDRSAGRRGHLTGESWLFRPIRQI